MEAPDLLDFSDESPETLAMYGIESENEHRRQYATNCLLARRLVERGVRSVLMMDASWDDHTYLNRKLPERMEEIDQPTAALIKDLKQRGLLDDTMVVWGGEFGRTPMVEIANRRKRPMPDGIITPTLSRCGWPAAASNPATRTARRMSCA